MVGTSRACFKKNSSLHVSPKNFRTTFLGIVPQNLQFLSVENSDDLFFLSHHQIFATNFFTTFLQFYLNYIFFSPSVFSYFAHDESYSYFLHTIHPLYTHPHAVFTFLHLALCSRNSSYCIHHLFRLNSSLHKQPFIQWRFYIGARGG